MKYPIGLLIYGIIRLKANQLIVYMKLFGTVVRL